MTTNDAEIQKITTVKRNRYVHYITLSLIIVLPIPILHNFIKGFYSVSYFLTLIELITLALYYFNKNHMIKHPLTTLIVIVMIMTAGEMLLSDGIRDIALLILPCILFVSSLSHSRKVVYMTLAGSLILVWFFGWLNMSGRLTTPISKYVSISFLIDATIILVLSAVAVDILVNDLKKILDELIVKSQELQDTNKKLNETNLAKDKFFTIIAHDLRSPLQGILGISNMIVKDHADMSKEEIIDLSKVLDRTLNNHFRLINSLLDWSRIQTGRMKYYPAQIDAYQAAKDAFYQLGSSAYEKNITIKLEFSQGTTVFADHEMLTMVFRNLLSNAIKYSHSNSEILITATQIGNEIRFNVIDFGVGMNSEDCERIFQLDNKTTQPGTANETGSGIGLNICSEILEKHGGKIWCESELNKGTTFYFTMFVSKDKFKFTNA